MRSLVRRSRQEDRTTDLESTVLECLLQLLQAQCGAIVRVQRVEHDAVPFWVFFFVGLLDSLRGEHSVQGRVGGVLESLEEGVLGVR